MEPPHSRVTASGTVAGREIRLPARATTFLVGLVVVGAVGPANLERFAAATGTAAGATVAVHAVDGDSELLQELARVRAGGAFRPVEAALEYERVFEARSARIIGGEPDGAIALLVKRFGDRPRSFRTELAAYLDDWALLSRLHRVDLGLADRAAALARAIDPDSRRIAVRDAVALAEPEKRRGELTRLAAAADVALQPVETLVLLARSLRAFVGTDVAIGVLEHARTKHGDDPWVLEEWGLALRSATPPRNDGAIRAFRAASLARPELGLTLSAMLGEIGRTAEAISILQTVNRRWPSARSELSLGLMLASIGENVRSAVALVRSEALARARLAADPKEVLAAR